MRISVIGGGTCTADERTWAEEGGHLLAQITGTRESRAENCPNQL